MHSQLPLGKLVPDSETVYRAFSVKGYRERPSKVRPIAFQRSFRRDPDGLSLGLTPQACVAGLKENFGYCSITVANVHCVNHGVEVRVDEAIAGHALICNLPCIDGTDEERQLGAKLAGDLSRKAVCVTCDPYIP